MVGLSEEQIRAALATQAFGRNLVVLTRTGSTNDVAKGLAAQGASEGTVVVADEQAAGRGRMGRRWAAPPGTCLLCSILFRPTLSPTRANRLTMLCSLAAADAVEEVAGLKVALKWPNDLIVKSQIPTPNAQGWKKLAGVLTETGIVEEQLAFAVVGIGINANVQPEVLPTLDSNATSILAETGREVDRVALLAALLKGVEVRYERLRTGKGPHHEWSARLATLGQSVEVITSDGPLVGVAESVNQDGALLLRTPDGGLRRLLAGDVTLRLS